MALAAIPLAAGPAVAAAAHAAHSAQDCERGGGLLSGVTDGLCRVVDGVTDAVDGLTGDTLAPVTDGLDQTTSTVLDPVGEVAPTTEPTAGPAPDPDPGPAQPEPEDGGLLSPLLNDICLPGLACEGEGVLGGVAEPPAQPEPSSPAKPKARPTPSPTATPVEREQDVPLLPTEAPTPPRNEPHLIDSTIRMVPEEQPVADAEEARIQLLWQGPLDSSLDNQIRDHEVVRPSQSPSDALGTALTAALLASAVLAARVVQQRGSRDEQDSIPFEPMRVGGRHHRLA